jgi:CHRD domain
MRCLPTLALVATALALSLATAKAIPITFTANLSGADERPNPVNSPGTGLATIVLDQAAHTIQISATFSGLRRIFIAVHPQRALQGSRLHCLHFLSFLWE